MKKLSLLLFIFSFAAAQQTQLTILHWNDFHSQNIPFQVKSKNRVTNTDTTFMVGGSATLASYIKLQKDSSKNVLLLNAGDDFQGTPISAITKGRSQIELMKLINPDAMELGNHDFDYGRDILSGYLKELKFPVLGGNMLDKRTGKPFAKPYTIITVKDVKIGVIGLMSTELHQLCLPDNIKDIEVKELAETVNGLIPELKKQKVNLIIAVTHVGVQGDSLLALAAPDLDIIVGGHSHTPLFKPKRVNGIMITQAGSRGRWLGKIDITVDTQKDTVLKSYSDLIECRTADVTPDPVVEAKVNEFESMAAKEMNEVIGVLKTDWKKEGRGESNMGNWITDALREYAKTDIAFQNSGGIRKEMLAGNIMVRDLWEISPFGNTLATFNVDGATLRSMIQFQLSMKEESMQFSGIKAVYRTVNGER
ncbi:MAG: bifunctional metallophosphatase/5'-nucleotidase, partial [Bacteroidota bacterium]